jgi:dephospho-CoA kinase
MRKSDLRVLGLSGQISAGKTTAGQYLKTKGYFYGRFSLVLADILKERGIKPTRESLQSIGEEVNKNLGQKWLCQQLILRLPREGNIVIDGLRFPEDHIYLLESFGSSFKHIYIKASENIRATRYVSSEEFELANTHPVEQAILRLEELADIVVLNEDTIDSFLLEIQSIVVDNS